jgi:hypothetical protein
VAFSCKKRGFCPSCGARCGAVTLIQRFGSALNLDVHSHMLWLDGVYEEHVEQPQRKPRLHRARAPSSALLTHLAGKIAHRVCRHLARQGWLEGEEHSAYLTDSARGDDGMEALRMRSITYRIATGAQAGRKVVTLQTLPGDDGPLEGSAGQVGGPSTLLRTGFSLHAGVAAEAHESGKLERLCRYIARPATSEKRLSISPQGRVRYQLKTPWRNGTTHVEFEPIEFMAKFAALVPPPRAHLTRFHGAFAPNAHVRAQPTPSGRGKRPASDPDSTDANTDRRTPDEKRRAMTWAQRREHLRPLRRRGVDRRRHRSREGPWMALLWEQRRPQSHPRHPRPFRGARRAGASPLPAPSARSARCRCVTPPRPRSRTCEQAKGRRRDQQAKAMRPRSRRAALGPLSATEGKPSRTALPKACQPPIRPPEHHSTTPATPPNRSLTRCRLVR